GGQVAVPEEIGHLLEGRLGDQIVHVEASIHQAALVAVDETDLRGRHHHIFEAGLQGIDCGVAHGHPSPDTRDDSGCLVPQRQIWGKVARDLYCAPCPRRSHPWWTSTAVIPSARDRSLTLCAVRARVSDTSLRKTLSMSI